MKHIGASPLTGTIYRGNLVGNVWKGKREDITDACINAVAEHLLAVEKEYTWELKDKKITLKLEVEHKKSKTVEK